MAPGTYYRLSVGKQLHQLKTVLALDTHANVSMFQCLRYHCYIRSGSNCFVTRTFGSLYISISRVNGRCFVRSACITLATAVAVVDYNRVCSVTVAVVDYH